MATSRLTRRVTLHFENVQEPRNLLTMIDALVQTPDATYGSAADVIEVIQANYHYVDAKYESITMATQLGLIERSSGGLQPTPLATAIHAFRPGVQEDILHFLLYSGNTVATDGNGRSWAYRSFCNKLWESERLELSKDETQRFTEEVLSDASAAFPNATSFSFSRKSLNGMRRWLEALDPPVMVGRQTFERRSVCSRELVLLAIAEVAQADGAQLDTDLLLSPDRRRAICQICLLEPTSLDRRLDAVLPSFHGIISPGTRTGAYGRFVRLHAFPTIEQLASHSCFASG